MHAPLSSRLVGAGLVAFLLALAGCGGLGPGPAGTGVGIGIGDTARGLHGGSERGRIPASGPTPLFAHGLEDIRELYVEPVSIRRLAMSGLAPLSRLDNRLSVNESFGFGFSDMLALRYDDRDIAVYQAPPATDSRRWGALLANMAAAARRTSPVLAAMSQDNIETAVLDGMTGALDRFSHYSPPALARDQRAARDGFGGIGVTLDTTDAALRVTAVTPQGPAENAGIRPEDQIVAVNGVATVGRPHQDVVRLLRGPIGSAVELKIVPAGTAQPHELRLRRALVVLPTVTMTRAGNIAIFRITSFNHDTTQRIVTALAQAERQTPHPLVGIVLDLRGNPGGLLDQAVSLDDQFIRKGPIISTVGRHPASYQNFTAAGDAIAPDLPIVVLINGGSASAAEIVAAVLQDVGRAVVIGSSSYGKGTVQTVLRLPNDGDLVVTWARLVAPSGYLLQAHGVVPTVCTAELPDDAQGLAAGLQEIGAAGPGVGPGAGLAFRPRASLDARAWAELRQSCPPRHTSPAIDLELAEHLLADPRLDGEALRALPAATQLAQGAAAGHALTDRNRTLSSPTR